MSDETVVVTPEAVTQPIPSDIPNTEGGVGEDFSDLWKQSVESLRVGVDKEGEPVKVEAKPKKEKSTPTSPEEVKEEVPQETSAEGEDEHPETKPERPEGAKGKTWADEVKSRKEATTKMIAANKEANEAKKKLAETESRLQDLETKFAQIDAQQKVKQEAIANDDLKATLTKALKMMTEVDPDEDPTTYHDKVASTLADALQKANEGLLQNRLQQELNDRDAALKAEQQRLQQEVNTAKVVKFIEGEVTKAFPGADGEIDRDQFWRIFEGKEIPNDVTIEEGVRIAIEKVNEIKAKYRGNAMASKEAVEKDQKVKTPLGRHSDGPAPTTPTPYKPMDWGDMLKDVDKRQRL